MPVLADKYSCTGCLACFASCRIKAISLNLDKDGHFYPQIDRTKCIECKRCETVCQRTLKYVGNNKLTSSKAYSAWATDCSLREFSTSGGIASSVSKAIIQNGGVVIGASFDGRYAKHILIDKLSDIKKLQGSKYVWSNPVGAYKCIDSCLSHNKVLFIGTGCQVAGVLSFFESHPFRDNLYTIDIICGGVPSDYLMQVFREMNPSVESILSFRSKRKYILKGIKKGEVVEFPKSSLPLSGFCAQQTNRYSCYNCPYAFINRCSDITIGDLWGNVSSDEQRELGISLVIPHSDRGYNLLINSEVTVAPLDWKDVLFSNRRLFYGHTPITSLRRKLSNNIPKMSYKQFSQLYSLECPPYRLKGFYYRVLWFLLCKINDHKSKIKAVNILNS